jgi:hypothetical protein
MNPLLDNHSSVYGFIHIATEGPWRCVLHEQFELLRSSGLLERATRIFLSVVGPDSGDFAAPNDKFQIVYRSQCFEDFEFPALRYLHEFCQQQEPCLVFYVHSKGVFRDTPFTRDWRKYMEHFVIERHKDCIDTLEEYDICGVNWQSLPWPHYSGNFWWARSEYVRKLRAPDRGSSVFRIQDQRHQCERWIGSGVPVRAACLYRSGLDHYFEPFPCERYADKPIELTVDVNGVIRRPFEGISRSASEPRGQSVK